ncbi:MAG: MFS transporter [Hyphomonadaceae bacterium]|nr:MFS transporter [Hyphomonadaceae bacterium]
MAGTLPPKLSLPTKLAYALGGVAYGIKGNGFSYFLMFCYAQAFGLPPEQVGLALLLAFMFDAFSDPLVGYLSDNTRSFLGRRHIYMYGAILPVGFVYYLLWNPPDTLGQGGLFWYLVLIAVGVRLLITFYEVPCTALSAELTRDYDERTNLLTLRAVFVYFGGVVMAASTLAFILQERDGASAFTDAEGFGTYGLIGALAIMASMLVCSLGTQRFIPHLTKADSVPKSFLAGLGEVAQTLKSPSLAALFASQLAGYAAFGVSTSLIYYLLGYFWGFSSLQSSILTASVLVSAVLALFIGPPLSRRLGKRAAAFSLGVLALILAVGPVTLRLLGLMPENGSPALFGIMLTTTTIDYACVIAMNATVSAMFSDLVEEAELRSGKRSEGLLFSVMTFTRKSVEGIGVLSASLILALISFPEGADPGEVDAATIFRLGALYAPAVFIFWALMLVFISRYRISRADHEANLASLAARAAAEQEDAGPHY